MCQIAVEWPFDHLLPSQMRKVASLSAQPLTYFSPLFTGVRGREILGSSLAGAWIKARNIPPRWSWPALSTLEAGGLSEVGCLCRLLNRRSAYPNISGVMSKRIDGPISVGVALTWPLAQPGKRDKDCDSKCALTASKSKVQASCPTTSGSDTSGTAASVATCSGNTNVSTPESSGCVICQ